VTNVAAMFEDYTDDDNQDDDNTYE